MYLYGVGEQSVLMMMMMCAIGIRRAPGAEIVNVKVPVAESFLPDERMLG